MGKYTVVSCSLNDKDVETLTKAKAKGWSMIEIMRAGLEFAKISKPQKFGKK